jgi:CspA family cold shock protein
MATGKVKWFNEQKGYGFIVPDEKGDDLFVHYSNIVMDGYKIIKEGEKVTFDAVKGARGMEAKNVVPEKTSISSPVTPAPAVGPAPAK